MIELRNLKGDIAQLYPDTIISNDKYNSLFSTENKLFEDISASFRMPYVDRNIIFFSGAHLIETPNSVHEEQVQVIISGNTFYAGTLRVGLKDREFDVLLLVNFGAVAQKAKKVRMCEPFLNDGLSAQVTAAFMKTVCENPENYPFSFFPVYNPKWRDDAPSESDTVNKWDHTAQAFVSGSDIPIAPFFKLTYILRRILDYLGFQCEGSFFDDPESDTIYIYSPISTGKYVINSTFYLPEQLLIYDFLQQIKDRFKISGSFDIFKGTARFDSASSLLGTDKVEDIRRYIVGITEISTSVISGYTVTLKPNETDPLFKDPINENQIPTNKLVVGEGENIIEISTSTLKRKLVADYSMPKTQENIVGKSNFQLRFLKYSGMKALAGGKVFPEALPMELTLDDAKWFQFQNDGKTLEVKALIPTHLMAKLNTSIKYGIESEQRTYLPAVAEKISSVYKNSRSEFVETTFTCHTVVFDSSTPVYIEPFPGSEAEKSIYENNLYKAYFNTDATGLTEVPVSAYYPAGTVDNSTGLPISTARIDTIVIKNSTDKQRGGGKAVYMPFFNIDRIYRNAMEIRISVGEPKYVLIGGKKINFIYHVTNKYYWLKPFPPGGVAGAIYDYQPIWIVF